MLEISQITTDLLKERLTKCLAEKVGFKKKWSVEAFAEACGTEKSTLDNYMRGDSLPTLTKFIRMCKLLGPGFTNRFLRLAGMDGAARIAVQNITDHEFNGEIAGMIGLLGTSLADGRIDHRERALVLRSARELLPILQDWIALNDRSPDEVEPVVGDDFLTMRNESGLHDA